jgi:hypothetical protein
MKNSRIKGNCFYCNSIFYASTARITGGNENHIFSDNSLIFCPFLPQIIGNYHYDSQFRLDDYNSNVTFSQFSDRVVFYIHTVTTCLSQFDNFISNYANIPYGFDPDCNSISMTNHNAINNTRTTSSFNPGFFYCGSPASISNFIFVQNSFDKLIDYGSATFTDCTFYLNNILNDFNSPVVDSFPITHNNVPKAICLVRSAYFTLAKIQIHKRIFVIENNFAHQFRFQQKRNKCL